MDGEDWDYDNLDGDSGHVRNTSVAHYAVQIDMLDAPLRGIAEDDLELA